MATLFLLFIIYYLTLFYLKSTPCTCGTKVIKLFAKNKNNQKIIRQKRIFYPVFMIYTAEKLIYNIVLFQY